MHFGDAGAATGGVMDEQTFQQIVSRFYPEKLAEVVYTKTLR